MHNVAATLVRTAPDQPELTAKHSTLVSHNIVVSGHRTSVRLEPEMWEALREICRREKATLHHICTTVSLRKHQETSLTAAIRVFIMRYFRDAATEEGHSKAGHGGGPAFRLGGATATPAYTPRQSAMLTKTSFY